MANYSTNQVRHIYVASTNAAVDKDSPIGQIEVKTSDNDKFLYFKYMGAGGQVRSDMIEIKNISYYKKTEAASLTRALTKKKLVLNAEVGAEPITGEEYLTRLTFRNYGAPGEAHQMVKHGVVKVFGTMTASDFYKRMVLSLVKNFARSEEGLIKFSLTGVATEIDKYTKLEDLTGTATGIELEELPQEWRLGTMQQEPVNFTVHPTTVKLDGFDVIWGTVTNEESTTSVQNGQNIADLEYFLMGERADVYRNVGFPYVRPTTYLVDPSQEYDTIDIHYAYQGPSEDIEKSQKDILIVSSDSGVADAIFAEIEAAVNPVTA